MCTESTAVDCRTSIGNDAKAAQDHDESSGTFPAQHGEQQVGCADQSRRVPVGNGKCRGLGNRTEDLDKRDGNEETDEYRCKEGSSRGMGWEIGGLEVSRGRQERFSTHKVTGQTTVADGEADQA